MKQKITLTESALKRIVSESIRKVLNEISPELKAKAMVKANHNLRQLGDTDGQVAQNLNGVPVHKDTQKRRRQRQLMAFEKGLKNDMAKKFGKQTNFSIDGDTNFSVDYDNDRFRHFSSSDGSNRGSVFFDRGYNPNVGHHDMRASEYLTNMVDAMAGYDSELRGHSPFNATINHLNDRINDVENVNKYHKDMEEFEKSKEAHDKKMFDYEISPWYKKPFMKKPLPFTREKPKTPRLKTGPYFLPDKPDGLYKRGEEIKGNHDTNMKAYNAFLKKKN